MYIYMYTCIHIYIYIYTGITITITINIGGASELRPIDFGPSWEFPAAMLLGFIILYRCIC